MIVKRQTHQPNLPYFYFWRFIMKNATKITVASAILAALASGAVHSAIDSRAFIPGFRGEIIRGALPPLFFNLAKVAKCPNGADAKFVGGTLSCTVDVAQFANVVCANPQFPRYVALAQAANANERDICASTTADGAQINSATNLAQTVQKATCDTGDTLLRHNTAGNICLNTNKGISFGANAPIASFAKSPANNHNAGDYYDATLTNEVKFNVNVDFERLPTDGSKGGKSYVQNVAIGDVDGQNWRLDPTQPGATDKYKRIVKRPVSAVLVNP
jgi:hypothetical protein